MRQESLNTENITLRKRCVESHVLRVNMEYRNAEHF